MSALIGVPYFIKTFTREEFKNALENHPENKLKKRLRIEWEDDPWSKAEPEWLSFYYDDKEIWYIGNKNNLKEIILYLKKAVGE